MRTEQKKEKQTKNYTKCVFTSCRLTAHDSRSTRIINKLFWSISLEWPPGIFHTHHYISLFVDDILRHPSLVCSLLIRATLDIHAVYSQINNFYFIITCKRNKTLNIEKEREKPRINQLSLTNKYIKHLFIYYTNKTNSLYTVCPFLDNVVIAITRTVCWLVGEPSNHDEEGRYSVSKPEIVDEKPTAQARARGRNRKQYGHYDVIEIQLRPVDRADASWSSSERDISQQKNDDVMLTNRKYIASWVCRPDRKRTAAILPGSVLRRRWGGERHGEAFPVSPGAAAASHTDLHRALHILCDWSDGLRDAISTLCGALFLFRHYQRYGIAPVCTQDGAEKFITKLPKILVGQLSEPIAYFTVEYYHNANEK